MRPEGSAALPHDIFDSQSPSPSLSPKMPPIGTGQVPQTNCVTKMLPREREREREREKERERERKREREREKERERENKKKSYLSGAICFKALVLLGNDLVTPLELFRKFFGAIFWFCESSLAPDPKPRWAQSLIAKAFSGHGQLSQTPITRLESRHN